MGCRGNDYTIVWPRVVEYPQGSADKLMDVKLPDFPQLPAYILWLVGYEDLENQRVTLGISIAPVEGGGVVVEMFDPSYEFGRKTAGENGAITIERDSELLELDIDCVNFAHQSPYRSMRPKEARCRIPSRRIRSFCAG